MEAVYFLDFLTGELTAVVVGKQSGDFGTPSSGQRRPRTWASIRRRTRKFMMVTGLADLRRSGGSASTEHVPSCYVAEVTSGKVGGLRHPLVAHGVPVGATAVASLVQAGDQAASRRVDSTSASDRMQWRRQPAGNEWSHAIATPATMQITVNGQPRESPTERPSPPC